MLLVQATIAKLVTADGNMAFHDDIAVGTTYLVDLDTIATFGFENIETRARHSKDMVAVAEPCGGWLPLECLRVHQDDVH